jgi:hypothetical protein
MDEHKGPGADRAEMDAGFRVHAPRRRETVAAGVSTGSRNQLGGADQAGVILLSGEGSFQGGIVSDRHQKYAGAASTALLSNTRMEAKGIRA